MSFPRQVLPDATYLISRRCTQRQFLLRPSKWVNQVVLFCLAVAARRYNMLVHAVCVLSSHYHMVVSDPDANLPKFEMWFDSIVARCLNALHGRWESMWASGSYSGVSLEDGAAVVNETAYALANPVAAGLVREGHQWPGLRLGPNDVGRPLAVRRPHFFFRPKGRLPEEAVLELAPAPARAEMTHEAFVEAVRCEVARREDEARREADRDRRGFLGRRAVLAASPNTIPTTWTPRRGLNPRIACRDRRRRVEAIQRLRSFVAVYRAAWARFKAGVRDVLFPPGTYALRVHLGVQCASP
jgi:REP element-mobilizing transposase RayT